MQFKAFTCGECGFCVELTKGPGREYAYRKGVLIPVPEDFDIPTCTGCGEEYLSVERAEELEKLLEVKFDLNPLLKKVSALLYQDVVKLVQDYSKDLRADDPRFVGTVVSVVMEDGSRFYWKNAFVAPLVPEWLCVFTEHYGDHVFSEGDVFQMHEIK